MSTGHVDASPLRLPFQGSDQIALECSRAGALAASERVGRQGLALLALYRRYGPLTDAESALRLGVERSTINARRNELVRLLLVTRHDTARNEKSGLRNTTWGLAG